MRPNSASVDAHTTRDTHTHTAHAPFTPAEVGAPIVHITVEKVVQLERREDEQTSRPGGLLDSHPKHERGRDHGAR